MAYDLVGAFNSLETGYCFTPEIETALFASYIANGSKPLSVAQLAAAALSGAQQTAADINATIGVTGGLPAGTIVYPDPLPPILPQQVTQSGTPSGTATLEIFPTGLPRFPDSNEEPFDGWVEFGMEGYGP